MWLLLVILFAFVIAMCVIMMVIGYDNDSSKITLVSLAAVVLGVILVIVCIFKYGEQEAREQKEFISKTWNNGVCFCGGTYKLFDTPGTKYRIYYVYECERCGHTLEFNEPMR